MNIEELKSKAEAGDAEAQFYMGELYKWGDGVPEDDHEALKWFRKAAKQGYAVAQLNLGGMYHLGRGVPKDEEKAEYWIERSGMIMDHKVRLW